jgi:succinylglutamate desuccinylase
MDTIKMLHEIDYIPQGLLQREATQLHEVLPGPTLIHLTGERTEPLFVSVLLHGDEDTGWFAIRKLLNEYVQHKLPRSLSLFIGNVHAARHDRRFNKGQPDYNRIWTNTPGNEHIPERAMTHQVMESMKNRKVFAGVDIHNNSGINPHYACLRYLDQRFVNLATLFSRTVVYFTKPEGTLAQAFSKLCPVVTVECGPPGQIWGVEHAMSYLNTCLRLDEIPSHPVATEDIDLFRTAAVIKVPENMSIGSLADDVELRLVDNLDHFNFRELPADTTLAWLRTEHGQRLEVRDEEGRDVSERYLYLRDGQVRTAVPVMPSMLTPNIQAIRQDCLGYLMERHSL